MFFKISQCSQGNIVLESLFKKVCNKKISNTCFPVIFGAIIFILIITIFSISFHPSISRINTANCIPWLGCTMCYPGHFDFSPFIKKMMLFTFCIKCGIFTIFLKFFFTIEANNSQFCNFFFCKYFLYLFINDEIYPTYLLTYLLACLLAFFIHTNRFINAFKLHFSFFSFI